MVLQIEQEVLYKVISDVYRNIHSIYTSTKKIIENFVSRALTDLICVAIYKFQKHVNASEYWIFVRRSHQ